MRPDQNRGGRWVALRCAGKLALYPSGIFGQYTAENLANCVINQELFIHPREVAVGAFGDQQAGDSVDSAPYGLAEEHNVGWGNPAGLDAGSDSFGEDAKSSHASFHA